MEKSKNQLNAEIRREVHRLLDEMKGMSKSQREEYITSLYDRANSIPGMIKEVTEEREEVRFKQQMAKNGAFNDGYQLSENIVSSIWAASFVACGIVAALICSNQGLSVDECINAVGMTAFASLVTSVGNTLANLKKPVTKAYLNLKERALSRQRKSLWKEDKVVNGALDVIEKEM